jgi:hypothetical protein
MPTGFIVPQPVRVAADAAVEANAEDKTLTVANFGKIQSNTGADGTSPAITNVILTLPKAADAAGTALKVQLTVAMTVQLQPYQGAGSPAVGVESIYLGGDGIAGESVLIAGTIGNYADIWSDGEKFHVLEYSGVLTKV